MCGITGEEPCLSQNGPSCPRETAAPSGGVLDATERQSVLTLTKSVSLPATQCAVLSMPPRQGRHLPAAKHTTMCSAQYAPKTGAPFACSKAHKVNSLKPSCSELTVVLIRHCCKLWKH